MKRLLLELLRSDPEFRRAVAAEVGLLEILERLDRLEERMVKLEERMLRVEERIEEHTRAIRSLQEQVAEHTRVIQALQEQMVKLQEQVARNTERLTKLEEQVVRLWEAVKALQEQVAEHTKAIRALQEEVKRLDNRLAALGARWGLYAEDAVREALYKVLEEYLGVGRVEKWVERDNDGFVFGVPAVVEIDVVVRDDTHYLIEVKSSLDRYDVYVFNRKCEFYARRVKPPRVKKLMVTFFADPGVEQEARALGVEVVKG